MSYTGGVQSFLLSVVAGTIGAHSARVTSPQPLAVSVVAHCGAGDASTVIGVVSPAEPESLIFSAPVLVVVVLCAAAFAGVFGASCWCRHRWAGEG